MSMAQKRGEKRKKRREGGGVIVTGMGMIHAKTLGAWGKRVGVAGVAGDGDKRRQGTSMYLVFASWLGCIYSVRTYGPSTKTPSYTCVRVINARGKGIHRLDLTCFHSIGYRTYMSTSDSLAAGNHG